MKFGYYVSGYPK